MSEMLATKHQINLKKLRSLIFRQAFKYCIYVECVLLIWRVFSFHSSECFACKMSVKIEFMLRELHLFAIKWQIVVTNNIGLINELKIIVKNLV